MTVFSRPTDAYASERFDLAITQERAHIVSELYEAVSGNGGTANLHLENPTDNDRSAIIDSARVSTSQRSTIRLWDGFSSAPSGGSSVDPDNLLMDSGGSSDTGTMNAATDVTFTGNNTHAVQVAGGGQGGNALGATAQAETFIMEPDRDLVLEVTNNSSNEMEAAISIVYFEINEVYVGA